MKRLGAALLAATMCLGLLAGCGGNTSNSGGTAAQNKVNKAWKDTVLYLSQDGEWMWQNTSVAEEMLLLDATHTIADDRFALGISYNPSAEDAAVAWHSADGKFVYFLGTIGKREDLPSTLYALNTADKTTTFVAEVITTSVAQTNDGVAYLEKADDGTTELYSCVGVALAKLAEDVYDFSVSADGDGIFYSRKNENVYNLYYVPADGNSTPTSLADGASAYYYGDTDNVLIYCTTNTENRTNTIWRTDSKGNTEPLVDNCFFTPKAVHNDTFYYSVLNESTRVTELRFYDGENDNLVDDSGFLGRPSPDANPSGCYAPEEQTAVNAINSLGKFNFDNKHTGTFLLPPSGQRIFYIGRLDTSKEGFVYEWNDAVLSSFAYDGGEDQERKIIQEKVYAPKVIPSQKSLYYVTPSSGGAVDESDMTLVQYKDGTAKNVVENVRWDTIHIYDDQTIMALTDYNGKSGNLVMCENGDTTTIAENVSYYLRTTNGKVFLISEGNLFLSDGKTSTRVADGVLRFYCGDADYGTVLSYDYEHWLMW